MLRLRIGSEPRGRIFERMLALAMLEWLSAPRAPRPGVRPRRMALSGSGVHLTTTTSFFVRMAAATTATTADPHTTDARLREVRRSLQGCISGFATSTLYAVESPRQGEGFLFVPRRQGSAWYRIV